MEGAMISKQELRKSALAIRKTLTEQECRSSDAAIVSTLINEIELDEYQEFLFFYPLKGEVSLLSLAAQLLDMGYAIAFPRVSGETMDFYRVTNLLY
jgi:5-formyltetrahydrofolate cyclo-ligase